MTEMQSKIDQNDWRSFHWYHFQKCVEANRELATKIASMDLEYQTDRWFNCYARSLKRARKIKATGLVVHCSEDFQLTFAAVSGEETLWTEQSGYKFFALDDVRKFDKSFEVTQFLMARVVCCLVDLIVRKIPTNLMIGIEFAGLDGVLRLPTHLVSSERLAKAFELDQIDEMKGETQRLEETVAEGDISHLKGLLDQGADINIRCFDGQTLLAHALDHQNSEMATFLMEQGIDIDPDDSSQTPLEAAIESGEVEIIYELLKQGVNVNRKGTDADGYPLHRLAWGYLEPAIFRKFVDAGADVTLLNAAGQTPSQILEEGLRDNPEHSKAIIEIIDVLTP